MYQLVMNSRNGTFALPVFGTRRTIWDALARHLHFKTYTMLCKVQGINPTTHKARFELVKVAQ